MASANTTSSTRKKKRQPGKVQVSFRLDRELKTAVNEAADKHGRTQSAQFEQCVRDGVTLQGLIKQVSDHLTDTIELPDGYPIEYKPNEDTCLLYIISAVELVIEKESREKEAAERNSSKNQEKNDE